MGGVIAICCCGVSGVGGVGCSGGVGESVEGDGVDAGFWGVVEGEGDTGGGADDEEDGDEAGVGRGGGAWGRHCCEEGLGWRVRGGSGGGEVDTGCSVYYDGVLHVNGSCGGVSEGISINITIEQYKCGQ